MGESKIKEAQARSASATAGLTSIYQLVDKTNNQIFSFQEHVSTSDTAKVVMIYKRAPEYHEVQTPEERAP